MTYKSLGTIPFKNQSVCLLTFILLGLFLWACEQETIVLDDIETEANREYSVAGPLMKLHVTMKDFLSEYDEDSLISEDDEGTLYYTFNDEYPFELDAIYSIDDVRYNWSFNPAPAVFANPGKLKSSAQSLSFTERIILNNEEGIRLDSLYITTSRLRMQVAAPQVLSANVKITLPEVTKDGVPLSTTFDVGGPNNNGFTFAEVLDGYKINFNHNSEIPSGYITFQIQFDNIQIETQGLTIPTITPISVDFLITDTEPEVAFGYFSNAASEIRTIDINFDAFEEFDIDEAVEFGDVMIDLKAESSIGVPFDIKVETLSLLDTHTNESKDLILNDNTLSVESASYANPIIPKIGELKINGQNSNILDFQFGIFKPNNVSGQIVANLVQGDSSLSYFISKASKINALIDVKIPLWLRAPEYLRVDTIDFDYNDQVSNGGEDEFTDNFSNGKLYVTAKNAFPFDLKFQAYAMDVQYMPVDSIFNDGPIEVKSPNVDSQGLVQGYNQNEFVVELDSAQVKRFRDRDVKYIFLRTYAVTRKQRSAIG